MPVNDAPPTVALALDSQNFTREVIRRTGVFVLNVPDARWLPAVRDWGARSGWDGDKIATRAGLLPGERVAAPRLAETLGYLEDRMTQTVPLRGVDLVLGEVVFAAADPTSFVNHRWTDPVRTLHHWGEGRSP
jgi:flavin reductase (DIM6/NTAB) family NADH-FMN oxidoreductase RutF